MRFIFFVDRLAFARDWLVCGRWRLADCVSSAQSAWMDGNGGVGSALGVRSSRGIFVGPVIYRCCTYIHVGDKVIYDKSLEGCSLPRSGSLIAWTVRRENVRAAKGSCYIETSAAYYDTVSAMFNLISRLYSL